MAQYIWQPDRAAQRTGFGKRSASASPEIFEKTNQHIPVRKKPGRKSFQDSFIQNAAPKLSQERPAETANLRRRYRNLGFCFFGARPRHQPRAQY